MQDLCPNLTYGKDYVVWHEIDAETGVQLVDAEIAEWRNLTPQPLIDVVRQRAITLRPALAEIGLRKKRNQLLSETDWTQQPDVPNATRASYASYRQALRDLPQQPGFPSEVDWPIAPQ